MFDKIIENLDARVPRADVEYFCEEDGLLHCSVCKAPVQTRIKHPFKDEWRVVHCVCKCKENEMKAQKEREEAEECERRRRICFNQTNMDSWNFQNDDRRNEKLSNAMQKYVENFDMFRKDGRGLLLYGTVGTGKTYYACCVANGLLDKGYDILVTSFPELVNKLQGMWDGKQEFIDSLNKYTLLVIDDLGVERGTEYMQEQIFNIVDSRYRSGLPFIVTTNLTMEQIKKPQDVAYQRIYDRVLERCHPIEVNGVSRRKLKVADTYKDTKAILGL